METNRQKKIAGVIQEDIADIIRELMRETQQHVLVSVTKIHITPDLADAKLYVSIFPVEQRDQVFNYIQEHNHAIRYQLAHRTRYQLRRVPELHFNIDDSLDYIEGIDNALKGDAPNPIENPDILPKRKKM